ncbi:aquaporin-4-like [Ptychodera flava]|uniref:aquaporin-4-like n=1 Tax=Ptychodera flava TaxID=63121 RepID=UPI003969ED4C
MAEETMVKQVQTAKFWRAVVGEFVATLIFVFVGILSTIFADGKDDASFVKIALCFGLAIATLVQCFGHISGAHINPAVTVGFMSVKKISVLKALLFIIFQCLGAIVGAALVYAFIPSDLRGSLGVTGLTGVSAWQGFFIEVFITFQLVFTIFATTDDRRTDLGGSASLSIGISVLLGHLAAVRLTGSSMNPARSLGPALVMNEWADHWIYWIGPLVGGLLAALLYEFVFEPSSSVRRLKTVYIGQRRSNGNVPTEDAPPTDDEENVALQEVKEKNGK